MLTLFSKSILSFLEEGNNKKKIHPCIKSAIKDRLKAYLELDEGFLANTEDSNPSYGNKHRDFMRKYWWSMTY